jgi:chromosome segregation ATPase
VRKRFEINIAGPGFKRSFFSAALLASLASFSQEVITVRDQWGKPISVNTRQKPVDATAARNIIRTIELALSAAGQEAKGWALRDNAVKKELAQHAKRVSQYVKAKQDLNSEWNTHNSEVKIHDAEVAKLDEVIIAHNKNLNRTKAEEERLQKLSDANDTRADGLDERQFQLLTRQSALDVQTLDLSQENSALEQQIKKIREGKGKSYRQLEALKAYATKINNDLKTKKWEVLPISTAAIHGAYEKIKEFSNIEFDGNKELQQLQRVKKNFVAIPNQ